MDVLDRVRHRGIAERRGLIGGLVSDVLGGSSPTSTDGGLLGSAIGGLTSALSPILSPASSTSAPATSATTTLLSTSKSSSLLSSSLSTSHVTTSLSSSASITSSVLSTSSATLTSSATPETTPPPTSSVQYSAYVTSSGGGAITITSIVNIQSAATPTKTSAPVAFLQNKPLEAGVFTVVGIVALVILIVVATFALRKRRRHRLDMEYAEAVSFDPSVNRYTDEKGGDFHPQDNWLRRSASSSSSSSGSHGGVQPMQPVYAPGPGIVRDNLYASNMGYTQQAQGFANPSYPVAGQGQGYSSNVQASQYQIPPRSPYPVYDPARSPPPMATEYPAFGDRGAPTIPQLNIISATPHSGTGVLSGSDDLDQPLPMPNFTPPSATAAAGAPPRVLNTSSTDGKEALAKDKGSSHSRVLDPTLPQLPQSSVLPASFGEVDGKADSAGDSALSYTLKVANE